ncbi:MAG: hypothetical protein C4B59_11625 [Candidatus Methanogaster sp.]|uniref:Uncharacterized protein n=1 Tax=Candidatus Methanogaster sp. TaxID=3386292 RepID=A0AC61L113_9EURY|nr:MAG: hypothetical protein C4B59_11625 [ANME-2 cluster archaeon]
MNARDVDGHRITLLLYFSSSTKTIKSLHSKGLLRYYRNENYSLTKEGVIMAKTLAEEAMKKQYGDLAILLVV